MSPIRAALAALFLTLPFGMTGSINPPAPLYTAASIVNAASYSAGSLAPNTIASIYGVNLSFSTEGLTAADMTDGGLPTTLDGVTVYVCGYSAGLFYVSPLQINFLVPNVLIPGVCTLNMVRDGFAGPTVTITLNLTGPGLFMDGSGNAIAQHLDGSLLTSAAPGAPGEWVVVYAVGLGRTVPDADLYAASTVAAPITNIAEFSLTLNGAAVPPGAIYYAGTTPDCVGLYQINLLIPQDAAPNPQIQISIGTAISAGQIQLPVS